MSVTFYLGKYTEDPEFGPVLGPLVNHDHSRPASCCEDAELYSGQCDHAGADEQACGCREFDINVSNANAAALADVLGLRENARRTGTALGGALDLYGEICGEATGAEFLGRIEFARTMLGTVGDAKGTLTTETVTAHGPTVVRCGRAPGYLAGRLDQLEALATEAQKLDAMVVWC